MNSNTLHAPETSWRQQHAEFIATIRAARKAESNHNKTHLNNTEKNNVKKFEQKPKCGEYISELVDNICGTKQNVVSGPSPFPILVSRVPALMAQADIMRKENISNGGRAAKARITTVALPGHSSRKEQQKTKQNNSIRGFGSSVERFANVNGVSNPVHIVNSNITSIGMQQAFGKV